MPRRHWCQRLHKLSLSIESTFVRMEFLILLLVLLTGVQSAGRTS